MWEYKNGVGNILAKKSPIEKDMCLSALGDRGADCVSLVRTGGDKTIPFGTRRPTGVIHTEKMNNVENPRGGVCRLRVRR